MISNRVRVPVKRFGFVESSSDEDGNDSEEVIDVSDADPDVDIHSVDDSSSSSDIEDDQPPILQNSAAIGPVCPIDWKVVSDRDDNAPQRNFGGNSGWQNDVA